MRLIYKYQQGNENTVPNALLCIPSYSSGSANDYSSAIAYLVQNSCITKVPMLVEYVEGD